MQILVSQFTSSSSLELTADLRLLQAGSIPGEAAAACAAAARAAALGLLHMLAACPGERAGRSGSPARCKGARLLSGSSFPYLAPPRAAFGQQF